MDIPSAYTSVSGDVFKTFKDANSGAM